jgi:predicted nucleic acid-binding protein
VRNLLLDTGAFVGLIDRSDRNSARCVEFFKSFRGNLYTTELVLSEDIVSPV